MVKLSIIFTGIKSTQIVLEKEQLRRFGNINETIHKEGLKLIGEVVESIAGRKSEQRSVDTGQFMNSIGKDSILDIPFVSVIQSKLPYAEFLEDGTTKIIGRGHFKHSLDRRRQSINKALKKASR